MRRRTGLEPAELWFLEHGLPYFVDSYRAQVAAGLRRARLLAVVVVALVLGVVVGLVAAGPLDGFAAADLGTYVGLAVLAAYAVVALRVWLIVGWAARRTFRSLGLLLPLAIRALPLLLVFMTFLFINAEVWQVSAALSRRALSVTVVLFAALAVGFLLTRLPEELDTVDDEVERAQLLSACRGTPLEAAAESIAARVERVGAVDAEVSGLQKANLVLVLLVSQALQVLLLAVAVFAFFLVFGVVAMEPEVVASWTGSDLHPLVASFEGWDGDRLSRELVQVSIFLAAFSGLYFTVYAVTDGVYREQFFASVIAELERAVSARVAYRALRDADPPRT